MPEHMSAFISDLSGETGSMVPLVTNWYVGSTPQKAWFEIWNMETIVITSSNSNSVTIIDLSELAEVL